MRAEDRIPYMVASALSFVGAVLGYYVAPLAVVLACCLGLFLVLSPPRDQERRLTIRDTDWWVWRSPLMGLSVGLLFRWVMGGLTATGGA